MYFVLDDEYTVYGMNNNTGVPPSIRDPRIRAEWTTSMDADDDEDSGIELVTVNNYQQRNINQLVSLCIYITIDLIIQLHICIHFCSKCLIIII